MTKKELDEYRDLVKERRQLRDRIAQLDNQLYDLRSPQITGMPQAHSTVGGSSQERAADRASEELEKLKAKYVVLVMEITAKCDAIENALEKLPSRIRSVFRAYYIDGLTWERVAEKNHWSISTLVRIKRRGFELLAKSDIV